MKKILLLAVGLFVHLLTAEKIAVHNLANVNIDLYEYNKPSKKTKLGSLVANKSAMFDVNSKYVEFQDPSGNLASHADPMNPSAYIISQNWGVSII